MAGTWRDPEASTLAEYNVDACSPPNRKYVRIVEQLFSHAFGLPSKDC